MKYIFDRQKEEHILSILLKCVTHSYVALFEKLIIEVVTDLDEFQENVFVCICAIEKLRPLRTIYNYLKIVTNSNNIYLLFS